MFKVPWADPIERALQPYQGVVNVGLVFIVIATIYVMIKRGPISKTAWLVWLMTP